MINTGYRRDLGGVIINTEEVASSKVIHTANSIPKDCFPRWVPAAVQNYIRHTERGKSIRKLAKDSGCHASTILRQVRKLESRRDDALVDEALTLLARPGVNPIRPDMSLTKDSSQMTQQFCFPETAPEDAVVDREARRILRRLSEPSACLAVAADMEKAVVVREAEDGRTIRTAIVERPIAQAMALKAWISCDEPGRISRYQITGAGRAALKRLLAESDVVRLGFSEGAMRFSGETGNFQANEVVDQAADSGGKSRYCNSESPVAAMARRRDKAGNPFLSAELLAAAERLREDFEVSQIEPKIAQNWEGFLAGDCTESISDGTGTARKRVSDALRDLGPGLGDVVLRVCCYLEGLESAEKRMGWSARSGKVVLRIALQRLKRHYESKGNGSMIG